MPAEPGGARMSQSPETPRTEAEAEAEPTCRGRELRARVIAAALPHVPFDGWSDKTLALAVAEAEVDRALARLEFPRGGIDLLLAYHALRDAALPDRLAAMELEGLRFRDKVAVAIDTRLDLVSTERDAVRRGVALCALPLYAPEGARALWHTADTIWIALGDASEGQSWYTKRASLSAIYSAALLYWLGDDEPGFARTRAFTRRRIDDLMRFEKTKARVAANPLAAAAMDASKRLMSRVRLPLPARRDDLPGWQKD